MVFDPTAPGVALFLSSSDAEMPSLVPLHKPQAALVELHQQMRSVPVDLPIQRLRCSKRSYAMRPTNRSSPYFSHAFDAFVSGRRCVSAEDGAQAEALVASETTELLAYACKKPSADGSMSARQIGVSLVIPRSAVSDQSAIEYIDGMAVYSDGTINDQSVPISTLCRFTIYGGENAFHIIKTVRRDALGCEAIKDASIVLRWADMDPCSNEIRARSEFISLNSESYPTDNMACKIQSLLIKLATKFDVSMPPSMYATINVPSCVEGYYEQQVIKASEHFRSLIEYEHPFVRTDDLRLEIVPNAFVRLANKEAGLGGPVSDTAMHAQLLCAEGHVHDANEFARQYRTGLPREDTTAYEDMALHTCGVSVEVTQLGGMITLYAHSGRSGQPISEPNTTLYICKAAIVPLRTLQERWNVYSCSSLSVLPRIRALGQSMICHLQRGLDMFHKTFDDKLVPPQYDNANERVLPTRCTRKRGGDDDDDGEKISDEDRFFMMAMGVDFRSKRLCLGDTISHLMHRGAPKTLVDLMTRMGLHVGLSASLQETFARCLVSIDFEENGNKKHNDEVNRLKRVADAALLMGCKKKPRVGVCHPATAATAATAMKKVRAIMQLHNLHSGKSKCRVTSASVCPRNGDISRSLASSIYECYARRIPHPTPHFDEVAAVAESHDDMIAAVSKGMGVCMIAPGVPVDAFVIVHGEGIDGILVYRVVTTSVRGCAVACGIGCIFEADDPAVMIVKRIPGDVCLLTPLVLIPSSS